MQFFKKNIKNVFVFLHFYLMTFKNTKCGTQNVYLCHNVYWRFNTDGGF